MKHRIVGGSKVASNFCRYKNGMFVVQQGRAGNFGALVRISMSRHASGGVPCRRETLSGRNSKRCSSLGTAKHVLK
jgi:hypothetical protein